MCNDRGALLPKNMSYPVKKMHIHILARKPYDYIQAHKNFLHTYYTQQGTVILVFEREHDFIFGIRPYIVTPQVTPQVTN